MDELNEYTRHKYAEEQPNLFPKEPEDCDHPEEAQQEVVDNIGEEVPVHSSFTECTQCGVRLTEEEVQ